MGKASVLFSSFSSGRTMGLEKEKEDDEEEMALENFLDVCCCTFIVNVIVRCIMIILRFFLSTHASFLIFLGYTQRCPLRNVKRSHFFEPLCGYVLLKSKICFQTKHNYWLIKLAFYNIHTACSSLKTSTISRR